MFKEIVQKTFRVPVVAGEVGDGASISRQLDVALMGVGFKLSGELLKHLSGLHSVVVKESATNILEAVRELVGDHVEHNVYFRDFPENVPDTEEFWTQCIIDALFDPVSASKVALQLSCGVVNLLDLPKYGKYQHSYEEMVEAHKEFIPFAKDRVTILHLGKSLLEETLSLYHSLAGSTVPLNENDRNLLGELAEVCLSDEQSASIPIRENRAVINFVRISNGFPVMADTVTDILRLACALSGGDETLETVTKFKSFKRSYRRILLQALDKIIGDNSNKLSDVNKYRERWKRLGEYLHPHEYKQLKYAQDVFAVARGDKKALSLAGRVELALKTTTLEGVLPLMSNAPGMLFRSIDRFWRGSSDDDILDILDAVEKTVSSVPGRVILSVYEHFKNRLRQGTNRIFVNKKGTSWVCRDDRSPLTECYVKALLKILDTEIQSRLPSVSHLVVNSEVVDNLAVPLSKKNEESGFMVMPRGSVFPVSGEILRLFIYWKEQLQRTDYDLSVVLLNKNFSSIGHCSYTFLRDKLGHTLHSGDVTESPRGASEFIDIDLKNINCSYIIPQVNVFSGEYFKEVDECFFGFMVRQREQWGKPFEPTTVRMKSDLRGDGRVALPLILKKNSDGVWDVKWMNIYLKGLPRYNRVEDNRFTASVQAEAICNREYLSLGHLLNLLGSKAKKVSEYSEDMELVTPVTFIGMEAPENLPKGSVIYTLSNMYELIPE